MSQKLYNKVQMKSDAGCAIVFMSDQTLRKPVCSMACWKYGDFTFKVFVRGQQHEYHVGQHIFPDILTWQSSIPLG